MNGFLPLEQTHDGWLVSYSVQTTSSAADVSGPYATRDQAERALASVAASMPDARVVRRGTCAASADDNPAPRLARACTRWARMLPQDGKGAPFLEVIPPTTSAAAPVRLADEHLSKAEAIADLLAGMLPQGIAGPSCGMARMLQSLRAELAEARGALAPKQPGGGA